MASLKRLIVKGKIKIREYKEKQEARESHKLALERNKIRRQSERDESKDRLAKAKRELKQEQAKHPKKESTLHKLGKSLYKEFTTKKRSTKHRIVKRRISKKR